MPRRRIPPSVRLDDATVLPVDASITGDHSADDSDPVLLGAVFSATRSFDEPHPGGVMNPVVADCALFPRVVVRETVEAKGDVRRWARPLQSRGLQ